MLVSTKVISAFAGVGSMAGLVVAIGGVILVIISVTDKIPVSSCLSDGRGVSKERQELLMRSQFLVGVPFLIGGILAFIGGVVGGWAGFKGNKRGLKQTAFAEAIAFVAALLGAFRAWELAIIFGDICEQFMCADECTSMWGECAKPDVCCECTGGMTKTAAMCKSAHDWSCDCAGRKTIGLVFALVTCAFTLLASSCACGATWCFPEVFDYGQMEPTGEEDGEFGIVVGKPIDAPSDLVVGKAIGETDDFGVVMGSPVERPEFGEKALD